MSLKKTGIIAAAVAVALVALAGFFILGINIRGGLPQSMAGLAEFPVLNRLLKARPETDEGGAARAGEAPADSSLASMLDFDNIHRLGEELERVIGNYRRFDLELDRKARELYAWEERLGEHRDELLLEYSEKLENLKELEANIRKQKKELEEMKIVIDRREAHNLRKAADIYASMDPRRAAALLETMYSDGQRDTVVKIVYLMRERSAAQALGAMAEAGVAAEITEKLSLIEMNEDAEG